MTKQLWCGPYDLLTSSGDIYSYLMRLRENGATGVRIFGCYQWAFYNLMMPFKEIRKWNPKGVPGMPFYDLGQWNLEYWDEVNYFLGLLDMCDLEVHVALHDFCSIKQAGNDKYYHPFFSCIQKENPDDPSQPHKVTGGFFGWTENGQGTLQPWHLKYFAKWVSALNVSGVPYYLEVMNETGRGNRMTNLEAVVWHKWAVDQLFALGVPKNRMIGSYTQAFGDDLGRDLSKQVGTWSCHGHARPQAVCASYPYVQSPQIIISTDGGRDGDGPEDPVKHWKGPSAAQMRGIAEKVNQYGYAGIEYKPRDAAVGFGKWTDVDRVDMTIVRAAGQVFGTIPPPPPPTPEPPAPPPPEPPPTPPVKAKSFWRKLWDWIKRLFG